MEQLLLVPWYIYAVIGFLFGIVTGKVFGKNFEGYFGYTFVGYVVVIVIGAFAIFALRLGTDIYGSDIANIAFPLFWDLSAFYAGNLISTWLFRN